MARRGSRAASPEVTTRERILDVALELFVRKGYAETSLREIAAELGFSKAALYYHFESKQDILLALHQRVHELTDQALPLLEAQGQASDETWLRLVDGLMGIVLRNRRLIELHMRNQDVIMEMHRDPVALGKHGPNPSQVEEHVMGLVRDPSAPVARRVRRVATLGIVGAALLFSGALADVSDADLEVALRGIIQDVLGVGGAPRHGEASAVGLPGAPML